MLTPCVRPLALMAAGFCLVTSALPAAAEETVSTSPLTAALQAGKPILDARLRYEAVDQDGPPETANALTYRLRAGFETGKAFDTRFLVEFDHIDDLIDDYNSTLNGKTAYPVIADPQATELNRLQLVNTSLPDTTVTLGRQRIILDDARFAGNVGWRQNEQTFDALRVTNTSFGKLVLDGAYVTQVNRVFGLDSPGGRWEGDSYILNASHPAPLGKLTVFSYLIDADEAPALSSQTYGARFSGDQPIAGGKLGYAVSYATQSDYGSSNASYTAGYYLADASYAYEGVTIGAAMEVLEADNGGSFQTPLATLHAFQGWSDKFLTTPAGGIRDISLRLGYTHGALAGLEGVRFSAAYHDFSAEHGSDDYGTEIDLLATAKWGKLAFTLKYADYTADTFATDTRKFWFQVDYAY